MDPAAELGSIIGGSDFDELEGFTSDEGANIEDQQPPSLDRLGLYQVCFVTFNTLYRQTLLIHAHLMTLNVNYYHLLN